MGPSVDVVAGFLCRILLSCCTPRCGCTADLQQPISISRTRPENTRSRRFIRYTGGIYLWRWHSASWLVESRREPEADHHFHSWFESVAPGNARASGRCEPARVWCFAFRSEKPRRERPGLHDHWYFRKPRCLRGVAIC